LGEKEKVAVSPCWLRTTAVNVAPEQSLNLLTYRDKVGMIFLGTRGIFTRSNEVAGMISSEVSQEKKILRLSR